MKNVPAETEKVFRAIVGTEFAIVRVHTRCPIQKNFVARGINELFARGNLAVTLIVETNLPPEYEIVASASKGYQFPSFYTLHKGDPNFAHM